MNSQYDSLVVIKKLNAPDNPYIEELAQEALRTAHELDLYTDDRVETSRTLYIAIGGDGTMLFAARRAVRSGGTVIGINTGNLGFLTEFDPKYISNIIERAVRDQDVYIEERVMLRTYINDEHHYAFNEFTISNKESDRAIQYGLAVDGERKIPVGEHKANSVIISTPTGSTAYSLNVGGSILEPDLDVVQIMPVAAMSMTTRPLIVSGKNDIFVTVRPANDSRVSIKADGQTITCLDMCNDNTFRIERVKNKVRILHDKDWNFFDTLTNKLHWNKAFV